MLDLFAPENIQKVLLDAKHLVCGRGVLVAPSFHGFVVTNLGSDT